MTDKALEEILKRVDHLGELTIETLGEILPMAGRFVMVRGIVSVFIGVLFAALLIVGVIKTIKYDKEDNFDDCTVWFCMSIVLGAINIGTSYLLYQGFLDLIASEWRVVELILQNIR